MIMLSEDNVHPNQEIGVVPVFDKNGPVEGKWFFLIGGYELGDFLVDLWKGVTEPGISCVQCDEIGRRLRLWLCLSTVEQ